MKTKQRVLSAAILSLFATFAAPEASAQVQQRFSNVYVFGDSLSDAGFYRPFLAGLGLPSAVVATLGRFTTNPGPVWSELVSSYYGFTPNPSNVTGGNIFAQGGARVQDNSASTPTGFAQRPVSTQIGEYLARGGGAADPNALYFVWAGGNDFLQNSAALQGGQISQAQFQANVLAAATQEIQQIARLRAAGARYIAVFGLPDIGMAPASLAGGAAAAAGASQLAAGYNTTLFTGLASNGIRVIPIDVFALMQEIRANPGAFGFTNVTGIACGPFTGITTSGNSQFCITGTNLVAAGADTQYLFADSVHPTSGTHRLIANLVESMIDGPAYHSMLAEAALRTRTAHVNAIGEGVTSARYSKGKWNVFAGYNGTNFDVDSGQGFTGMDSRARSLTMGVTARISEAVTLGGAYGFSKIHSTFPLDAGGFTADEHTGSVFGSVKWGGFYGTAVLSIAELEFSDITRNLRLGSNFRVASGKTDGSNGSAQVNLGYDFRIGRLTIGPTVGATSQNVDVNGFDESGGGAANLRMGAQKRKSEVWSAGARASLSLGQWTPWIKVTADKERRDEMRLVTATPLTMAAIGSSYDVPGINYDNKFITWQGGINGWVTDRVGLSVTGYKVQGRSGVEESGINAMVSIGF